MRGNSPLPISSTKPNWLYNHCKSSRGINWNHWHRAGTAWLIRSCSGRLSIGWRSGLWLSCGGEASRSTLIYVFLLGALRRFRVGNRIGLSGSYAGGLPQVQQYRIYDRVHFKKSPKSCRSMAHPSWSSRLWAPRGRNIWPRRWRGWSGPPWTHGPQRKCISEGLMSCIFYCRSVLSQWF